MKPLIFPSILIAASLCLLAGCSETSADVNTYGPTPPVLLDDTLADITLAEGECEALTFDRWIQTSSPSDESSAQESAMADVTVDDPRILTLVASTRNWQAGGDGDQSGESTYGDGTIGPVFIACGASPGSTTARVYAGNDPIGSFSVLVVPQTQ